MEERNRENGELRAVLKKLRYRYWGRLVSMIETTQDERVQNAQDRSGFSAKPLDGLKHPDPAVRKKAAERLRREGSPEDLAALHEANKRETQLNCKVEILKAIVELEQRFLMKDTENPLACRLT